MLFHSNAWPPKLDRHAFRLHAIVKGEGTIQTGLLLMASALGFHFREAGKRDIGIGVSSGHAVVAFAKPDEEACNTRQTRV